MTTLIEKPMIESHGDWQTRKPGPACATSPDHWFITVGDADDESHTPDPRAEALCTVCPVRDGCLREAMERDWRGTWGGTTYYQRLQMKRKYQRRQCPNCRGVDSLVCHDHQFQLCLACGVSWSIF